MTLPDGVTILNQPKASIRGLLYWLYVFSAVGEKVFWGLLAM